LAAAEPKVANSAYIWRFNRYDENRGFADALSAEREAAGIASIILCPGLLNTKIWDGARPARALWRPETHEPKISKQWDDAKTPDLMWPEIERSITQGGGDLICATDDEGTQTAFEARTRAISSSIVQI
jgi:hypothetical protein